MSRSKQLAQRRKELVVRSTVLRAHMLADGYLMRYAATPSRIGSDLLSTLREHKLLIAGVVVAAIVVKPRRFISGLKAAVIGWQTWRNVVPLLQNFMRKP